VLRERLRQLVKKEGGTRLIAEIIRGKEENLGANLLRQQLPQGKATVVKMLFPNQVMSKEEKAPSRGGNWLGVDWGFWRRVVWRKGEIGGKKLGTGRGERKAGSGIPEANPDRQKNTQT